MYVFFFFSLPIPKTRVRWSKDVLLISICMCIVFTCRSCCHCCCCCLQSQDVEQRWRFFFSFQILKTRDRWNKDVLLVSYQHMCRFLVYLCCCCFQSQMWNRVFVINFFLCVCFSYSQDRVLGHCLCVYISCSDVSRVRMWNKEVELVFYFHKGL